MSARPNATSIAFRVRPSLLVTAPPGLPMPETLLMAYYGNGRTQSVNEPVGTLPTRDRSSLPTSDGQIDVSSILFRMLRIHELRRAQSFPTTTNSSPTPHATRSS
ncbi:hypothetical protein ABZ297_35780 [Nonomuraea sp. NPDC005983]|uniref:hypothetical protein n=1 Tax=Nonomuraea sp. NPDC005983 TaxID=3155595 RepID=UPI0033A8594A